jgi:hypothetical protein
MNTNRTTRFAAVMLAVLMAAALNGAMLWKFDAVAQEAMLPSGAQASTVTLETVNITAPRS